MKNQKQRDPIKVMLVWTVCLAVLAAGVYFFNNAITEYRARTLESRQQAARETNEKRDQEYAKAKAEFEWSTRCEYDLPWPAPKDEGWDVIDLTSYPLENATIITVNRSDVMNNGMLLVNEWHSRPDDFSEENLVSIGKYTSGNLQVDNYNLQLFPVAIDALVSAVNDAKALGYENYIVEEAYRSWDAQNELFNKYMEKYADSYTGDALIERTKRDVNYPGTSEFNSGLAFTLRLYKKGDAEVNKSTYVNTAEGQWMSENCWKYGLVFRFPKTDYPVKGTADKSYKTGVSVSLRAYRYVGLGNAAVMHTLDLCLEEYIEYLQEHPHIAVFEDGVPRYEIIRQYVGDEASSFQIQVTKQAKGYVSSLDNMGGVITVFEY